MVTATRQSTDTNTLKLATLQQIADVQRIARALKRSEITRKYSHGTIKRSAMAMINYYIRSAAEFMNGNHHGSSHGLHVVM